eukprot:TRINITY_DN20670_c0_g1_i1.p1 TRINITY_DN20670_c0_g1~~TRINITY_DN20670_c0_g1_i1.p1  ORF type:complete len:503 (-),score=128.46 TRINITY_DN20670_c0_g1_i1:406-1914(-)
MAFHSAASMNMNGLAYPEPVQLEQGYMQNQMAYAPNMPDRARYASNSSEQGYKRDPMAHASISSMPSNWRSSPEPTFNKRDISLYHSNNSTAYEYSDKPMDMWSDNASLSADNESQDATSFMSFQDYPSFGSEQYGESVGTYDNTDCGVGAAAAARPRQQQFWWRLFWCYERVHKLESEPLRSKLSEAVKQAGGKMICIKKSTLLESWIRKGTHTPFILLADRRELKPCLDIISHYGPLRTQHATVVLGAMPQNFGRQERVRAYLEINDAGRFVDEVLRDYLSGTPSPARGDVVAKKSQICHRGNSSLHGSIAPHGGLSTKVPPVRMPPGLQARHFPPPVSAPGQGRRGSDALLPLPAEQLATYPRRIPQVTVNLHSSSSKNAVAGTCSNWSLFSEDVSPVSLPTGMARSTVAAGARPPLLALEAPPQQPVDMTMASSWKQPMQPGAYVGEDNSGADAPLGGSPSGGCRFTTLSHMFPVLAGCSFTEVQDLLVGNQPVVYED